MMESYDHANCLNLTSIGFYGQPCVTPILIFAGVLWELNVHILLFVFVIIFSMITGLHLFRKKWSLHVLENLCSIEVMELFASALITVARNLYT